MRRPWYAMLVVGPTLALSLVDCQSLVLDIFPADASAPPDRIGFEAGFEAGTDASPDREASSPGMDANQGDVSQGGEGGPSDAGLLDIVFPDGLGETTGTPINCAAIDANICDDFDRTVLIPTGDTRWGGVTCSSPATIGVDGTLNVTYPAANGGNCTLNSFMSTSLGHPIASVGSFQVDFDLNYYGSGSGTTPPVVAINVDIVQSGFTDQELFQLEIQGDGSAQLGVLFAHESYLFHELGSLFPPPEWATPGQTCHITMTANTTAPSGSAKATCGGVTQTLTPASTTGIPAGFAAPASVNIGYAVSSATATPKWELAFDNFVFQASP